MAYLPKPIETAEVQLDESLISLQELLAANAHDHWAGARMAEGWTFGPTRDETLKKTPCLVPYESLPETEKTYDRLIAMESIKVLLKLGYQLSAPSVDEANPEKKKQLTRAELLDRIIRRPVKLSRLHQIWHTRKKSDWLKGAPLLYQILGELACKIGEPFFACDVVNEGLGEHPHDRKLRQLLAWALAQCGATHDAEKLLRGLPMETSDDIDTIGLLGRCHKDFACMATDPLEREAHFQKSAEIYQHGFEVTRSSYLGLNAATLFYLIDEHELAKQLAVRSLEACRSEMEADPAGYWHHATLAELSLLLDGADVEAHYRKFREAAGDNYGVIFSARKQARLILQKKGLPATMLDECLHVPPVVVFSGHMIDGKKRPIPRFPAHLEDTVRGEIVKALGDLGAGISYSSAACGSDILFLEAMRARGGEYHLVLPLPPAVFRKKCVVDIGGTAWGKRFDGVLAEAASVTIANPQDKSLSPTSLQYGNQLVHGMARIRARTIGSPLKAVAAWNGKPGDGKGGTASCVETWKSRGEDVVVLNPFPAESGTLPPAPSRPAPPYGIEVRAIFFADIVGYSKLSETDIPLYAKFFLTELGALVDQSPHRPLIKNTWGDAIYFVFENVRDAGLMALEIQRFVCEPGKWTKLGFSRDLSLRTALHAGPVYSFLDGITGRKSYSGSHVNRAARIEPIAQVGQVFVSEQFAALVEAEGITDFRCDYVGEKELPKKAGSIRAHVLRRMLADDSWVSRV